VSAIGAGCITSGARALEDDIESLWRDPAARSRNRHFDRFTEPRGAYARRVVFFLLDLREILRRLPPGTVRIVREAGPRDVGREGLLECRGRVQLSYRDAVVGFSRIVFLTERELALLVEDPDVAAHVEMTGEEAAP
jgi:hypothetical protein